MPRLRPTTQLLHILESNSVFGLTIEISIVTYPSLSICEGRMKEPFRQYCSKWMCRRSNDYYYTPHAAKTQMADDTSRKKSSRLPVRAAKELMKKRLATGEVFTIELKRSERLD